MQKIGMFFILGVFGLVMTVQADEPIYLGVSIPLTGEFASYGRDLKEALELGREEINTAGGINERPLEFIYADSEGQPLLSKRIARKFTEDSRIVAAIGDFSSSCSMAAQPIYDRAGMVQFSPTSSHSAFAPGSPYSFSVSGTSQGQSSAVARIAVERLRKSKLAVLYLNTDWGVAEQQAFVEEARRLNADIAAIESYPKETTDFTSVLQTLRSAQPELLYLCSLYQDGALISLHRQQIGWNDVVVMGAGPLHSKELVDIAGDAVEGLFTSTSFFPQDPRPQVQEFVKRYQARYQRTPNLFAAQAYDVINIIANALHQVGDDRRKLRDEIAQTKDYPGAIGQITFSQYGDIQKQYILLHIKNGEFVIYHEQ